MTFRKRVVLAYFSNPQHAPLVINSIRRLSREYGVTVVSRDVLSYDCAYPSGVTVHKAGRHLNKGDGQRTHFLQMMDVASFIGQTRAAMRHERPRAILSFDMHAAVGGWLARGLASRRPTWLYHQNETCLLREIPRKRPAHWLKRLELKLASAPDLISFPEPNRARLFLEDARVERDYCLVENCPPVLDELPSPITWMAGLQARGQRIVLYQGAIGPGIDLEPAIRSIPFWPADSVLVVVGHRSEAQRNQLLAVAREAGVADRVVAVPFISSHPELLRHTVAADVGLILYRGHDMNTKYAAPCKFFEYMACQVPVVVSADLPYLSSRVSALEVGAVYAKPSPEAIAAAVSGLLESEQRARIGEHARDLHLARFNFESQFQPLLEAIDP